jgi:hypothetical protein
MVTKLDQKQILGIKFGSNGFFIDNNEIGPTC